MSFSGLSIALSIVFGCLVLALVAQLYYFLWWKKRRAHSDIEMGQGNYAKGVFYRGCWDTPFSLHAAKTPEPETKSNEQDLELGGGKDVFVKSFGEEGVESELMRLHKLAGPPRFLFTIKEETKEDLESEDGKSRSRKRSRTRSLSDLMLALDTPLASSPLKCPLDPLDFYKHQGFNPLFESSAELEFNRFRSSPPPKFKFMRDAEEKLYTRLFEDARRKALQIQDSVPECGVKDSPNATTATDDRDGSFLRIIDNKDTQLKQYLPQFPSSSNQVLPLASSPTPFIPLEKPPMVH